MTIKATWLLTTDLVSELACKSPIIGMPIYVNAFFGWDLGYATRINFACNPPLLGSHPIISDNSAPDYTCTQDIINYYWSKNGYSISTENALKLTKGQDCGCRLGGAHELYCEKWQAY